MRILKQWKFFQMRILKHWIISEMKILKHYKIFQIKILKQLMSFAAYIQKQSKSIAVQILKRWKISFPSHSNTWKQISIRNSKSNPILALKHYKPTNQPTQITITNKSKSSKKWFLLKISVPSSISISFLQGIAISNKCCHSCLPNLCINNAKPSFKLLSFDASRILNLLWPKENNENSP